MINVSYKNIVICNQKEFDLMNFDCFKLLNNIGNILMLQMLTPGRIKRKHSQLLFICF